MKHLADNMKDNTAAPIDNTHEDTSCQCNHTLTTTTTRGQNPKYKHSLLVFGVSAPSSCKSYYIYYIIFNLIKKTCHTWATGLGFWQVTLCQPVPVPALPVPGTRVGL